MKLRNKKWLRSIALVLVLSMVPWVSACGIKEPSAPGVDGSFMDDGHSIAKSTDLNVMLESPVLTLDPQKAVDKSSFEVIAGYTDGLMQMNERGQAVRALCQNYRISEDGLVYTFKIRADADWSNGTPVTAQDFVFAWQRAVNPANECEYAYMLSDVGCILNASKILAGEMDKSELGVTALDDKTLQVELASPVPYFLSLLYFPTFYPVNEDFYNACGDRFGSSHNTVLSNGAFVLDSYEEGATAIHLSRNEQYYEAQKVKASGIAYQVIQDSQLALLCYERGSLDTAFIHGEQVAQAKERLAENHDGQNMGALVIYGTGCLWYVTPNGNVPELANRNIRMALTMAVDREYIVDEVLQDGSIPTYTVVPQEFVREPGGGDFSGDQSIYSEFCADDKERALEYWNAGLEELQISELTLELLLDVDDAPRKVAESLKAQWEKALPGLTVNLMAQPKDLRVKAMQNGEFQLGLTGWGPDYADPVTYLGAYVTGNSNNYGYWSNPYYDELMKETAVTADMDVKKRFQKLHEAEALIMEDAAIFPLYTQSNAELRSSMVSGIQYHPFAINRVFKYAVADRMETQNQEQ